MREDMNIEGCVRTHILDMEYLPWGDAEGLLLKWGYSPGQPSPRVIAAIEERMASDVAQYPARGLQQEVMSAYSFYAGVRPDNVTLVNGCDKAFRLLAEVFINPGDELLMFSPSYPILAEAVTMMGGRTELVPLSRDFTIEVSDALLERVSAPGTKLLFIVNPNNPTSNVLIPDFPYRVGIGGTGLAGIHS